MMNVCAHSTNSTALPTPLPLCLISGISERAFIWKYSPCSSNQVKMKSYSFSVGPKMDVLINEVNLETELECCALTEAEVEVYTRESGNAKDCWLLVRSGELGKSLQRENGQTKTCTWILVFARIRGHQLQGQVRCLRGTELTVQVWWLDSDPGTHLEVGERTGPTQGL